MFQNVFVFFCIGKQGILDIFQIFKKYYPVWSYREVIIILFIMLSAYIIMLYFLRKNKISLIQCVTGLIFLAYLILVFGSTVFTRISGERRYKLEMFWSWKEILFGSGRVSVSNGNGLLFENLLNMVMLLPLGILLPFVVKRKVKLWQGLLIGMGISFMIEILQLILCRGLFEFDDIIHNGVGCMAGVFVSMSLINRKI